MGRFSGTEARMSAGSAGPSGSSLDAQGQAGAHGRPEVQSGNDTGKAKSPQSSLFLPILSCFSKTKLENRKSCIPGRLS